MNISHEYSLGVLSIEQKRDLCSHVRFGEIVRPYNRNKLWYNTSKDYNDCFCIPAGCVNEFR